MIFRNDLVIKLSRLIYIKIYRQMPQSPPRNSTPNTNNYHYNNRTDNNNHDHHYHITYIKY